MFSVNVKSGMALMDKPAAGKLLLDDTVLLTAVIEASQNLQSHTVRGIRNLTLNHNRK